MEIRTPIYGSIAPWEANVRIMANIVGGMGRRGTLPSGQTAAAHLVRDPERDVSLARVVKYVPVELSWVFAGLVALASAPNRLDGAKRLRPAFDVTLPRSTSPGRRRQWRQFSSWASC